jgi:hypothetical protein
VVEMTSSASISLGSEFNDFLFAPIGEDRNGMLLSVLSMLARQDVDPWEEAAKLARLPGDVAIQRLASFIALLPDRPSSGPESGTIAARLIALLPRRTGDHSPLGNPPPGGSAASSARGLIFAIVLYLVFATLLLNVGSIVARSRLSAQVESVHETVSSDMPQPTPSDDDGGQSHVYGQ